MKVLLTGANGQLGQSLIHHTERTGSREWIATDYHELDITNFGEVEKAFIQHAPDAVVNCAAYTAVDKAETEPDLAWQINALGPENLAKACKRFGSLLVHISTDYVFPGTGFRPYREEDPTGPPSRYGQSKLDGELAVKAWNPRSLTLRTSWLYSAYGNNFVKTMMRLGAERSSIRVVSDQTGSPTWAHDLATAILSLLKHYHENPALLNEAELYHLCNTGTASWFDLATAIMEIAKLPCQVIPIATEEYPLPAPRPFFSVMETRKIRQDFGMELPYWRTSLENCIRIIQG